MKPTNPLYAATLLAFFTTASLAQNSMSINGTLNGYEDGVRILINRTNKSGELEEASEQTLLLKNGKFIYSDTITEPRKYFIRVRPKDIMDNDFNKYEMFTMWAESKPMTLTGNKGEIEFAHVTGSATQTEFEELNNLNKAAKLRNKHIIDSVKMYPNLPVADIEAMRKVYRSNLALIENDELDFIYSHPDLIFCQGMLVSRIRYSPDNTSKDKVASFYAKLSAEAKGNPFGKIMAQFTGGVLDFKALAIGEAAYPFSLQNASGKPVSLASLKGKTVLLDFWFSACAPCRAEHANYFNVYQKYRSMGFEIISVSIDNKKAQWLSSVQADNMIWQNVWDEKNEVFGKLYHIRSCPSNYLINAEGIVIDKELYGEKLLSKLATVFKK